MTVLSEMWRVLSCVIFNINIPIWFRVDIAGSFALFLDLADQVCLPHLDVCLCLTFPAHQLIKWKETELLYFELMVFLECKLMELFAINVSNSWEMMILSGSKSKFWNSSANRGFGSINEINKNIFRRHK